MANPKATIVCTACKEEKPRSKFYPKKQPCRKCCEKIYRAKPQLAVRRFIKTKCLFCGVIITDKRIKKSPNIKYCSKLCGSRAHRKSRGYRLDLIKTPGNKGAFGELVASADLLMRGYIVFRAICPNSPCDVIALKDGKILRIEVRTGYKGINGKLYYAKTGIVNCDNFAIVLSANEVIYQPALPTL